MTSLHIGTIVNTIGLKGEVKIYGYSDFLEERFKVGSEVSLTDGTTLKVKKSHFKGNLAVVSFYDIDSIEKAEQLKNQKLFVDKSAVHDLETDEFYFFELKGCDVIESGQVIGKVIEVLEYPAAPVLRIEGETTFLLPFVKAYVKSVDVADKKIEVELIEGMR